MTELLLITDVPRLRKVFARLRDEQDVSLRVANSLEKGAEEILSKKPDMIFVQTHLSGFSGDILLAHLKKQLGRRRSRFILLGSSEKLSPEAIKLYHGHVDTSLPDGALFDALRETVASLSAKGKKTVAETAAPGPVSLPLPEETVIVAENDAPGQAIMPAPLQLEESPVSAPAEMFSGQGPALDEQGLTYSPRARVKVYSGFDSSFENAVDNMRQPESSEYPAAELFGSHLSANAGMVDSKPVRSKRARFLLWLVPALIAVIGVTLAQNRSKQPNSVDVAPLSPSMAENKKAAPAIAPALTATPLPVQAAKPAPASIAKRPSALPSFIPRYAVDKGYAAKNPGWERYKGEVTEFKVYREGGNIKAIQVVDHGGHGVPESFMKAAMRQLTGKPDLTVKSSEKKDGFEIQRGQVAENIDAVYYRDIDGETLRAFVVTWR